jgi:nitrogen fixation-related uncharacterized protein
MNSEYSYDYDYDDIELESNKGRGVFAFLLVFVIIAVVVVLGFLFWSNQGDDASKKQVVIEESEQEEVKDKKDKDKKVELEEGIYSTEGYSVEYPEGWQVVEPSPAFRVLSLMKGSNRIEIFKLSDFDGNREFNFTGKETPEEVDSNVPKEFLTIGTGVNEYNVWLFYLTGDEKGKDMLHDIYDSIEVTSMGELG